MKSSKGVEYEGFDRIYHVVPTFSWHQFQIASRAKMSLSFLWRYPFWTNTYQLCERTHISEIRFFKSLSTSKFCPKAIFFWMNDFCLNVFGGLKIGGQKLSCTIVRFPPCAPSVAAQQLTQILPIFRVCLSLDSKYFFNLWFKICFTGIMAWEVKLYHSLSSMGGWRFASLSDIRRGTGWSNRM